MTVAQLALAGHDHITVELFLWKLLSTRAAGGRGRGCYSPTHAVCRICFPARIYLSKAEKRFPFLLAEVNTARRPAVLDLGESWGSLHAQHCRLRSVVDGRKSCGSECSSVRERKANSCLETLSTEVRPTSSASIFPLPGESCFYNVNIWRSLSFY